MRNLTSEMATEFASQSVSPVMFADMFFDSGTLRLFTGYGTMEYNGETYTGGGNFIGISPIEETQESIAKGIICSLNGIPSTAIALALVERCRARPFKLYLGAITTTSYVALESDDGVVALEDGTGFVRIENELIASPYRIFSGLMDVIEIQDSGETCTLRLSVENILIMGQRNKVSRYTDIDQQNLYAGDIGLNLINSLQDKEIVW